jgi:hypothetical protein
LTGRLRRRSLSAVAIAERPSLGSPSLHDPGKTYFRAGVAFVTYRVV